MTDKEIIANKVLEYIGRVDINLDFAREEIEELQESIKISEEVEDFLIELKNNEQLPIEIREKAEELWKKI